MVSKVGYDQFDFLNYVGSYVMNVLGGGKVTYSTNMMFNDDQSVTFKWQNETYNEIGLREVQEFEYRITFDDMMNIRDPAVLGKIIVDKYRETQKQAVGARPRSLPEKQEEFKKDPERIHHTGHWMYVWEVIELLKHLNPDDRLTPDVVNNLTIGRHIGSALDWGGNANIGRVNFAMNKIEFDIDLDDIGPFGEEAKDGTRG